MHLSPVNEAWYTKKKTFAQPKTLPEKSNM